MILYRWQGVAPNFGDELNTVLWPRLLPQFFDGEDDTRFLGIGSVLDQRHPPQVVKVVAGSGYGGYEAKPVLDRNWIIHWVRGPRTAAAIGLPTSLGLGDPAMLLPHVLRQPEAPGNDIGFMPHFESAQRGMWRQAATLAGARLIDPRDPPLAVLRAVSQCRLLLTEALHGAIVADALRRPWVAIRPLVPRHRAKWLDWADTLGLALRFHSLPASTLTEWANASFLSRRHITRQWLGRHGHRLQRISADRLVDRAGRALRHAAQATPQLSDDIALDRCQSRLLDAVAALRLDPFRNGLQTVTPIWRSRLHPRNESAYHLNAAR